MLPRQTLAALVALPLAGCLTTQGAGAQAPQPSARAVEHEAVLASSLGPGDVFEARVYGEPELSGVYRVGPEGAIVFPLCGEQKVAGLTATATAERLRACLADGYIKNPQVTVLIKEYNSKKIFVFGEVQKPGTFTFETDMTIVQAITEAGGFGKMAAQNNTSVTRLVDGQEVKIKVPVQDVALDKAQNFLLKPGDIVFVPESPF